MSRLLLWLFGMWIFIARPTAMTAQVDSYDQNALRLHHRQGDIQIVRGAQGSVLGTIGPFRGVDVAKLVASSEQATAEAKRFARDYRPGTLILGVGIVAMGARLGVGQIHDVNHVITTGLLVGSVALIVYGGGRLQNAYNALERAIWWYNRDLRD